jgi:hypothetical protein
LEKGVGKRKGKGVEKELGEGQMASRIVFLMAIHR